MITIEQDFENEIEIAKSNRDQYPYIDLVVDNAEYRSALFEQFNELKPIAKESIFVSISAWLEPDNPFIKWVDTK